MNIAEKLMTIAENVDKVYEAGKRAGGGDGWYDTFWDAFQQNGNRTAYPNAFYGWTDGCFRPKYDIVPTGNGANSMFYKTSLTNIKGMLEASGVVLDTSKATDLGSMFNSDQKATSIPVIDASSCLSMNSTFRYLSVTEIAIISLRSDCTFTNTFKNCPNLVNLSIAGTIGNNGIDLNDSRNLSAESIKNILSILEDKTGDTSGTEWKITLGSTNLNKVADMMENDTLPEDVTVTLENGVYKCKGWTLAL
jgi:hypothetical protein